MTKSKHLDTLEAIKVVVNALEGLDEAQQKLAVNTVSEMLGLAPSLNTKHRGSNKGDELDPDLSPKQFMRLKRPETDVQKIACLAYYLTKYREQPHFKTLDLSKLNTEAAGQKLANAAAAVKNSANQNGFLAQAGGGKKQITAFGEDVVEALPDQSAVKSLMDAKPKKRKKKNKK